MPDLNLEEIKDSFVSINDQKLFLRRYVVNDLTELEVLFLHDGLGCVDSFGSFPLQLCKALGKNGIAYDRIGHGRSDAIIGEGSLDYLERESSEVLPQILKLANLKTPIIVGISDGATIALLYGSQEATKSILALSAHAKVEELTINGVNNTFQKLSQGHLTEKLKEMHGDKSTKLLVNWASHWLSEEFRSWNILDKLEAIDCPVLLIQGDDDPYATRHHCKSIADVIGESANFIFMKSGGHLPHHKDPEFVIHSFVDFLK